MWISKNNASKNVGKKTFFIYLETLSWSEYDTFPQFFFKWTWFLLKLQQIARGVIMVIVVGNGHGDTSSKLGRGWLNLT